MRTTVTLDDDVVSRLQDMQRKKKLTFKDALNVALRFGLEQQESRDVNRKPFKIKPRNMGEVAGLRYENIGELLEQIEGSTHR